MKKTSVILTTIFLAAIALFIGIIYLNTDTIAEIIKNAQEEVKGVQLTAPKEEKFDYQMVKYDSKEDWYILDLVKGELAIESTNTLCGAPVMKFTNYGNTTIHIAQNANFGSERPIQALYKIDVPNKTCRRMNISSQVGEFGGYEVAPDGMKMAVALETTPTIISLLDFQTDTAKVIARAKPGTTFNGGFGGLSNNFVMVWTDANTLQYEIYQDVPIAQAINGLKPQVQTQVYTVK